MICKEHNIKNGKCIARQNRANAFFVSFYRLLLPLLMLLIMPLEADAFSFSQTAPSGQMLYFNITSGSTVTVVNPNWNNYAMPTGLLELPAQVEFDGTTYNLTAIGQEAFGYCTDLTGVIIPEGVVSIGTFAFTGCAALDSIVLPSTLVEIRSQVFYGTGYVANNSRWEADGLLYIGEYLIATRPVIDSVITVKDGTRGLAAMSFYYNQSLKMIRLPESLVFIGGLAFSDCGSIDTVELHSTTPPSLIDDSFDRTPAFTVKVPCECSEAYSSHPLWGQHPIVEMPCGGGSGGDDSDDPDNPDNPDDPDDPDNPDNPDNPNPNDVTVDTWTDDNGIVINASEGAEIIVFDIMGRVIDKVVATSTKMHITLRSNGIYIVRVEDEPFPNIVEFRR